VALEMLFRARDPSVRHRPLIFFGVLKMLGHQRVTGGDCPASSYGGFTNEPAAGVVSAEGAAEGIGVDGGDAAGVAVD
jgi:hypothetical protein